MSSDIGPWLRTPDESARAFEAFEAYRDLGPARSTAKVAQALGKSKALMDRWSARHAWAVRVEAFDAEESRLWQLERTRARRETADRQARIAGQVLEAVAARLRTLDVEQLSPADLVRWLDVASKVERAALGLPERLTVTGADDGPIRVQVSEMTEDERRERLRALRAEIDNRLMESLA